VTAPQGSYVVENLLPLTGTVVRRTFAPHGPFIPV
jgi:hypothetical protein